MDIDTNNIKLNLNKVRINEKNERWIEQDIIVPDNMPDALKIISINSIPYINDIEINKNRAKVVGKISYNAGGANTVYQLPLRRSVLEECTHFAANQPYSAARWFSSAAPS